MYGTPKKQTLTQPVFEDTSMTEIESMNQPPPQGAIFIRINIPDINLQKCLQFNLKAPVSKAKNLVIDVMGRDLKDPLNYGLFWPPQNGKTGKFLQDDRPLKDYPLQGPIGFLEFKYKRRNYNTMNISMSKLKKLHSKSNLKQVLDLVKQGDVPKVYKWLNKGIDPNFHCRDTGETPLTIAAKREKPRELIMALANGGAHLDYRSRDSMTPLHKAASCGNYDAIKSLLDLGQSPNTLESKCLTPLYYTVVYDTRAICAEALLYDHSILGVEDEHGLQEIHQACRYGRLQHMEHLVSYGADLNAVTKNGNTPLHICALTNQEGCARILLFRGAQRLKENNNKETPEQLALLSQHRELAMIISDFKDEDIVELKSSPAFNNRRRTSVPSLRANMRCSSLNRLPDLSHYDPSTESGTSDTAEHSALQTPSSSQSSTMLHGNNNPQMSNGSPKMAANNGHIRHNGFRSLGVAAGMSRSVCNLPGPGNHWDDGTESSIGTWSMIDPGSLRASRPVSTIGGPHLRASLLPMLDGDMSNFPRAVVLQKGTSGYGFVLRGSKASTAVDFHPSPEVPALQYFESIQPTSPADRAGLKRGDFVLEINNMNVVYSSHEDVVKLIRETGDTLALKVVTVDASKLAQQTHILEELDNTLAQYEDSTSLRSVDRTAGIKPRSHQMFLNSGGALPLGGLGGGLSSGSNSENASVESCGGVMNGSPLVSSAVLGVTAVGALSEVEIRAKMRANAHLSANSSTTQRVSPRLGSQTPPIKSEKKPAPIPPIRTCSSAIDTNASQSSPVLPNKQPIAVAAPASTQPPIDNKVNEPTGNWQKLQTTGAGDVVQPVVPESRVVSMMPPTELPSGEIVTVVEKEPAPDYSDSEEDEPQTGFQAMLRAAVKNREAKQHHKTQSSQPQTIPAVSPPVKAIPPPPPLPPAPPTTPVQLRSSTTTPKTSRPESSVDHEAHLRQVIARRRRQIEEGSNPAEDIENQVQASKQGTRSMVFGAAPEAPPPPPMKSVVPPPTSIKHSPSTKLSSLEQLKSPVAAGHKQQYFPATKTPPTTSENQKPPTLAPAPQPPQPPPAAVSTTSLAPSKSNGTNHGASPPAESNFRSQAEQLRQQAILKRQKDKQQRPESTLATNGKDAEPPKSSSNNTTSPAPRGSMFFSAGGSTPMTSERL